MLHYITQWMRKLMFQCRPAGCIISSENTCVCHITQWAWLNDRVLKNLWIPALSSEMRSYLKRISSLSTSCMLTPVFGLKHASYRTSLLTSVTRMDSDGIRNNRDKTSILIKQLRIESLITKMTRWQQHIHTHVYEYTIKMILFDMLTAQHITSSSREPQ